MGNMTVRRIPDHVHDHLRECARSNGRSLEAEVRAILTSAYTASKTGGFGQQLRRHFENAGVFGDELSAYQRSETSDISTSRHPKV